MRITAGRLLAATLLIAALEAAPAAAQQTTTTTGVAIPQPASRLAASLPDPLLRDLVARVLAANPELAAAAARARAASLRAPQVKALPDPMLGWTAFVAPPETRVGPQRLMVAISQRLPWFGKLALHERAALLEAGALGAEVEARRLGLVTETRRIYYELAFLRLFGEITGEFRQHLVQHEEIARTRYATGVGLGQGVVKLQAEITRVEQQLLEIGQRRSALLARLEALLDGPVTADLAAPGLPELGELRLDRAALEGRALELRPELVAVAARIAHADALRALAEKAFRPDFTVGLTFTAVERRDDLPGRLSPPPGNGDDILGLQGGVTLPVRRGKLRAALEEAAELRRGAEESERAVRAGIAADVGELTERIELGWQQLRLLDDVLVLQAEEALDSARAGYVAGTLNALDLLDAEHVLFGARTAVARAAADFAIYLARLEGVVAEPLEVPES